MATLTAPQMATRPVVRRAADWAEAPATGPGELHRAAHNAVVNYHLQELTGDRARGFATMPGFCIDKPGFTSPWHYHECQFQIDIILQGTIELAYSQDHAFRLGQGDIFFIPGGAIHDVSHPSADYHVAEFTFPGAFSTIEVEAPAAGAPTTALTWSRNAARRSGCERGLITYTNPVPDEHRGQLSIQRQWRTRVDAFEPGMLTHDGDYQIFFVLEGWREIAVDGETSRLGVGDLVLLPRGAICRDLGASDVHEAVLITIYR